MTGEVNHVDSDTQWWREAGDVLGLTLRGFDRRVSAAFLDPEDGTVMEMRTALAKRLRAHVRQNPLREPLCHALSHINRLCDEAVGIKARSPESIPLSRKFVAFVEEHDNVKAY